MTERLAFGYGANGGGGDAPATGGKRHFSPPAPAPGSDSATPPRRALRERTDWAFVGLMCFTALLYFRPQDTFRILNPLHLAELAAIGALGAMIAGRLGRGLQATRFTPELVGVAALGFVILATAPFSIWMGGAVGTFTGMFVKVMLIFILMVNTLTTPKRIEQFTWLIVVATAYIAFRAVFDYARGMNLIENGRVQGAIGGMFRNPNDLALNMVAVLPLAVSLALRRSATVWRLFAVVAAALMIGAVVASQSRSGTVGLAAMGLVLGFQLARRRPVLAFAGALVLALSMPAWPDSYWERVASITDASRDQTGSREARSILMREAWATFLKHPVTGVGAGQFQNYKPEEREEAWRETHNVVLQVAAELGVVGLLVFGFLLARGGYAPMQTRRLLRQIAGPPGKRRNRKPAESVVTPEEYDLLDAHSTAIGASLAGWFVSALFASVAYHWTFYYLLALATTPRDVIASRLGARQVRRGPVAVETVTRAAAGVRA